MARDKSDEPDDGYCRCQTPVVDSDVGDVDGDDDFCWRCKRAIEGAD
jgi:hypothetical protein